MSDPDIQITLQHHGKPVTFTFPHDATMRDLSATVADELSVPSSNQKFLISPKTGLIRPPFIDSDSNSNKNNLPLSTLLSKRITLMGSTASEVTALSHTLSTHTARTALHNQPRKDLPSHLKPATPAPTSHTSDTARADALYTFHTLRPLPHLPHPARALALLAHLRSDPGIRAAMRRHRFSVGLLTEMDPAAHTSQASRTLGLNRNRGEVIELRLRTDAYDGYRHYPGIRRTLCHELAHCVWSEHDSRFWELCRRLEREVDRDDWVGGRARTVGEEVYYRPEEEDEAVDEGGWRGGEYVLGGDGGGSGSNGGNSTGDVVSGPVSRRQILAQAAERRMERTRQVEEVEEVDETNPIVTRSSGSNAGKS